MAKKGIGLDQEQEAHHQGQTHLLVIAIDAYRHCPPLYNCVKDAHDLMEVLTAKYGIKTDNITSLFNEEATRDNIYQAFEKLVTEIHSPDNLLIYFSGHGEYNKHFKQGYWIPVNAEQGRSSQYIPNSEIRIFLSAIPAHHIFLMADSCFSGSLFSQGADRSMSRRYESDPSRWGLTSGRNEIVSDGKPGNNSPFAESLLHRLRQNTGAIGVQELCAHVVEYVQSNADQSPIGEPLKVSGHKNGQFVFHLHKDEARDWILAQKSDSVSAYQAYLTTYPESQHRQAAEKKVRELQEIEDWGKVKAEHSIFSYNRYLSKYTDGRYEMEAREALRRLEDDQSWKLAQKQGTLSAMYDYQDKHPKGQYIPEAKKQINILLEAQTGANKPPPKKTSTQEVISSKSTKSTPAAKETRFAHPTKTPPSEPKLTKTLKAIGGTLLLLLIFFLGKQLTGLSSKNNKNPQFKETTEKPTNNIGTDPLAQASPITPSQNSTNAATEQSLQEKYSPQPVVSLNGYRRNINKQQLAEGIKLQVNCLSSNNCNCKVTNFDLVRLRSGEKPIVSKNTTGDFSLIGLSLVKEAKPGDRLFFQNVQVKCNKQALLPLRANDFSLFVSSLAGLKQKVMPEAVAYLPNIGPDETTVNNFKQALGLQAKRTDCTETCDCTVDYFALTRLPKGGTPLTIPVKGSLYSAEALKLIRQASSGDRYFFSEITTTCNGTKMPSLNSLTYLIK